MRVTAKGFSGGKMPAPDGVTIELSDMDAGYLRKVMQNEGGTDDSFAWRLFNKLDLFSFPAYEARYPDWRKAKN